MPPVYQAWKIPFTGRLGCSVAPWAMASSDEAQRSPLPCAAAQVLLAALLRFSPAPRTKANGSAAEVEHRMTPSTMACLLLGLQNAACSEDFRIRSVSLLAICLVISWGSD